MITVILNQPVGEIRKGLTYCRVVETNKQSGREFLMARNLLVETISFTGNTLSWSLAIASLMIALRVAVVQLDAFGRIKGTVGERRVAW